MQLPIGVFGVAVATITLPVISRIAADVDTSRFGPTLGRAMRLALFLTLPSAVGLWFMAEPVIGLVYQHGQFVANDTRQTALALQFYALGLVAYSGIKVVSPAFYAINRKWTPMLVSFGAVGLNIVLNYYFMFRLDLGHKGLALSTTICAMLNFLILYLLMRPAAGTLDTKKILSTLLRCGIACLAIAAVCLAGKNLLPAVLPQTIFFNRILAVLGTIGLAATAYLAACLLLRVEETRSALDILRRKLKKPRTL
jgi:putative peptidoglycan lipid II flippase